LDCEGTFPSLEYETSPAFFAGLARDELDCPQCQHRMARVRKGITYVDRNDSNTFANKERDYYLREKVAVHPLGPNCGESHQNS
jgi:hypothetical protein